MRQTFYSGIAMADAAVAGAKHPGTFMKKRVSTKPNSS
jgi:hypothetical protein